MARARPLALIIPRPNAEGRAVAPRPPAVVCEVHTTIRLVGAHVEPAPAPHAPHVRATPQHVPSREQTQRLGSSGVPDALRRDAGPNPLLDAIAPIAPPSSYPPPEARSPAPPARSGIVRARTVPAPLPPPPPTPRIGPVFEPSAPSTPRIGPELGPPAAPSPRIGPAFEPSAPSTPHIGPELGPPAAPSPRMSPIPAPPAVAIASPPLPPPAVPSVNERSQRASFPTRPTPPPVGQPLPSVIVAPDPVEALYASAPPPAHDDDLDGTLSLVEPPLRRVWRRVRDWLGR